MAHHQVCPHTILIQNKSNDKGKQKSDNQTEETPKLWVRWEDGLMFSPLLKGIETGYTLDNTVQSEAQSDLREYLFQIS